MSDIEELQRRITAAMDRIARGAEGAGAGDSTATAALQTQLEEERLANAQLTERVKRLSDKQESAIADARSASEAAQARVVELDLELQRLRRANDQLRQANQALREANEAGVGEPHLINKAMLAELEGLRAARAADVAEASQIIATLTPLLDPIEEETIQDA